MSEDKTKTWYEELHVRGDELVEKVKELVTEANVRRIFIKNAEGKVLLEVPLTAGVAVTAVTAYLAPVLVAIGAIAALLTSVTIGVERQETADDSGAEDDGATPELEAPGGGGR